MAEPLSRGGRRLLHLHGWTGICARPTHRPGARDGGFDCGRCRLGGVLLAQPVCSGGLARVPCHNAARPRAKRGGHTQDAVVQPNPSAAWNSASSPGSEDFVVLQLASSRLRRHSGFSSLLALDRFLNVDVCLVHFLATVSAEDLDAADLRYSAPSRRRLAAGGD